jgi:ABC-2 type transport system permease protein
MYPLLKKELRTFLSSLIGYAVICVFLLLIGLFMWVFEGDMNTLDNGYAGLDTLFYLAPWVFMFLIPAITMRSFADERKSGTIEWLLTRPVTDMQIIVSKYLAGLLLVCLALLPTLVYYYTVWQLGTPPGNVDSGGVWGSYLGLVFLASAYVAIGIFASVITSSQVVAFLLSVLLCFFLFSGLHSLGSFKLFGALDGYIIAAGMQSHYASLSLGLIDSRDVSYFLALSVLFLFLTELMLKSRKW